MATSKKVSPAKKTTSKAKPSTVKTVKWEQPEERDYEVATGSEGYLLLDAYSTGVHWDAGPSVLFATEEDALIYARQEEWVAPFVVAKASVVTSCV